MFEPLDLLEVSLDLGNRARAEEKHLRSAINRAYFAMHLKARWGLENAGLLVRRAAAEDHGAVIRALRANRRGFAGEALNQLRLLRDRADYDLDITVDRDSWLEAQELARRVQSLLSEDWS